MRASRQVKEMFKGSPCLETGNYFLWIETGRSFPQRQFEISLCRVLGEVVEDWPDDLPPDDPFTLTVLVDRGVGSCTRFEVVELESGVVNRARAHQDLIEKALPLSEVYIQKRAELRELVAEIDGWPFQ